MPLHQANEATNQLPCGTVALLLLLCAVRGMMARAAGTSRIRIAERVLKLLELLAAGRNS